METTRERRQRSMHTIIFKPGRRTGTWLYYQRACLVIKSSEKGETPSNIRKALSLSRLTVGTQGQGTFWNK